MFNAEKVFLIDIWAQNLCISRLILDSSSNPWANWWDRAFAKLPILWSNESGQIAQGVSGHWSYWRRLSPDRDVHWVGIIGNALWKRHPDEFWRCTTLGVGLRSKPVPKPIAEHWVLPRVAMNSCTRNKVGSLPLRWNTPSITKKQDTCHFQTCLFKNNWVI